MKVIRAIAFANGTPCPHAGKFLKSADFEAFKGRGFISFTRKIDKAMKFKDLAAALTYWQTQSTTMPYRPDGKPNRPLTALTAEIEEVPS